MTEELEQFGVFRSRSRSDGIFLDIFSAVGPPRSGHPGPPPPHHLEGRDVWLISPEDLILPRHSPSESATSTTWSPFIDTAAANSISPISTNGPHPSTRASAAMKLRSASDAHSHRHKKAGTEEVGWGLRVSAKLWADVARGFRPKLLQQRSMRAATCPRLDGAWGKPNLAGDLAPHGWSGRSLLRVRVMRYLRMRMQPYSIRRSPIAVLCRFVVLGALGIGSPA